MEGHTGISRTARFENLEITHILLKMRLHYFVGYKELCRAAEFIFLHSQGAVRSRALTRVASSLGTGRSIWRWCNGEKIPPHLQKPEAVRRRDCRLPDCRAEQHPANQCCQQA